MERQ